jgi:hypothetical protein
MTVLYVIVVALGIILLLAIIIKPKEKKPKSFSWDDSLDPVCITVEEIANGTSDILVVCHDYGPGGWQFYDGKDVSERNPKVLVKSEILRIDNSINEIVNLETGWKAQRNFKGDKWMKQKI